MESISSLNDKFCNIQYDATGVFTTRLRTGDIDDTLIRECVKAIRITRKEDIKILKEIVKDADKREPQWFEEVDYDSITAKRGMFGPLKRIFSAITEFQPTTGNPSLPKRVFRFSPKKLTDDFSLMGFSELAPDMQVIDYRASQGESYTWNNRDCFGEVDPSNNQGPKVQDDGTFPKVLLQTSDYARHYLTCRPLLLFCAGLLIFGTKFCVGIYDREGVVFSTIHDMFDEMDIFVRVIRSITHALSIQELGLDPTVRILTDEETMFLTGEAQEIPSVIIPVSPIGLSTTYWCTLGRPTWTSSSLFGRGTTVWTVKQCQPKKFANQNTSGLEETPIEEWVLSEDVPMVLKSSWRSSISQRSESEMYEYLQTVLPNFPHLAKFDLGGDVYFPKSNTRASAKPITVRNLRDYPNCSDIVPHSDSEPTLVLHRVVHSTVGDYLWNYNDDLHLLRRFRDALLTHKALTERGFLHRDINPGNILFVRTNDKDKQEIILAGVEYALFPGPSVTRTEVQDKRSGETLTQTHIKFEGHSVAVGRGPLITRNSQFMAYELLRSLLSDEDVQHEVRHDIESFLWSLFYCIMRHISEQGFESLKPDVTKEHWAWFIERFKTAFGQTSISNIFDQRGAESLPIRFLKDPFIKNIINAFVSNTLRRLVLRDLNTLIFNAHSDSGETPVHLTYESVLQPINKAINELEVQASPT